MTGSGERAILIPSSLTMESRDLRVNTLKVGSIARAAAVFRVNRIVIYKDKEFDDSRFISMILGYMDTPQYLRKMLIPRREELRHVGMLPPLRTAHHPTNSETSALKIGEYRVGAVVESVGSDGGAWVEIGVDRPIPLRTEKKYAVGQRLNIRIFSRNPLAAEPVDRKEIPQYWGYETEVVDSLESYLGSLDPLEVTVLLTSRKGRVVTPKLLGELGQKRDLAVVFGSPAYGVDAFLSKAAVDRYCMINTIPHQGTETVRVEEAVFATLALLNLVRLEE
ncbi:MAG TPA: putative RNA uridine N3 methyltransferase [Methanotrichaceae archaeon]|nr:putative RNA uridine N3 methyltransferase [Methanotrichaceae archaeon]